jgi:hypothetical protein
MDFPTSEPQIVALADRMLNGYTRHAADFPHIPILVRIRLISRYNNYMAAQAAMVKAFAALRIATKAKNNSVQALKKIMKQSLQKSEVDVAANPEKLKLIGWGPRTEPQPAQLPTQPTNLQITANENQIVTLKWDRPDDVQPVRNYIVESRHQKGDGFCDWTIVQVSYSTQTTLRNQPLGIQLEYRVKAANNAGTGPASNTVTIVL